MILRVRVVSQSMSFIVPMLTGDDTPPPSPMTMTYPQPSIPFHNRVLLNAIGAVMTTTGTVMERTGPCTDNKEEPWQRQTINLIHNVNNSNSNFLLRYEWAHCICCPPLWQRQYHQHPHPKTKSQVLRRLPTSGVHWYSDPPSSLTTMCRAHSSIIITVPFVIDNFLICTLKALRQTDTHIGLPPCVEETDVHGASSRPLGVHHIKATLTTLVVYLLHSCFASSLLSCLSATMSTRNPQHQQEQHQHPQTLSRCGKEPTHYSAND